MWVVMKTIGNIIVWVITLSIPGLFIFGMIYGSGIIAGHCDSLRIIELKNLISAEERMAMEVYYQCKRTDLTKIPYTQALEVIEIYDGFGMHESLKEDFSYVHLFRK